MKPPTKDLLYRIIAQREGLTITAETKEISFKEAKKAALSHVQHPEQFQPYVLMPLTTQERWDSGYINFCPRCGANIADYDLEENTFSDCYECDATLNINIAVEPPVEEEE